MTYSFNSFVDVKPEEFRVKCEKSGKIFDVLSYCKLSDDGKVYYNFWMGDGKVFVPNIYDNVILYDWPNMDNKYIKL